MKNWYVKQRHFEVRYWNLASRLITETLPFKNTTEAFQYLYSHNFKPLTVKFKFWK